MKKILLLSFAAILCSGSAFAFIPASAITSMTLPVYGIYMSSDPYCKTGLVATVPLSTMPQAINFVANPTIGVGAVPGTINCVIIVVQDSFSGAWAPGNYTGTSYQGGNPSYNDSNCNSGGSVSGQPICHGGNGGPSIWPDQIKTDAAAIGLTLQTGTCGATTDVVPLVLSTQSVCTGQNVADAGITGCNVFNFTPPTTAQSKTEGTRLVSPSGAGALKFIVNPANSFGADTATTCGNIGAPLFSFGVM